MDEPGTTQEEPPPAGDQLPLLFAIGLWVPVFAVILWFMIRLFTGRWIHEPANPVAGPRLPEEHEPAPDPTHLPPERHPLEGGEGTERVDRDEDPG